MIAVQLLKDLKRKTNHNKDIKVHRKGVFIKYFEEHYQRDTCLIFYTAYYISKKRYFIYTETAKFIAMLAKDFQMTPLPPYCKKVFFFFDYIYFLFFPHYIQLAVTLHMPSTCPIYTWISLFNNRHCLINHLYHNSLRRKLRTAKWILVSWI